MAGRRANVLLITPTQAPLGVKPSAPLYIEILVWSSTFFVPTTSNWSALEACRDGFRTEASARYALSHFFGPLVTSRKVYRILLTSFHSLVY